MSKKKNNAAFAVNLVLLALGMLCLAYASVPLYRLFCEATGYGGTTRKGAYVASASMDRAIKVRFNADIAPNLPWEFRPAQESIDVKIGEQTLTHYIAQNNSDRPVTGHAVYNVVPFAAGSYFVKIECFCFKEQTLAPGQRVEMPVVFYIDPAMANDKELENMQTITLSYTFFPVKK